VYCIRQVVNFGSCAHYIGTGGGARCPLIKRLPPIRAWGGGLGHFDQPHLEINSNNQNSLDVMHITHEQNVSMKGCFQFKEPNPKRM
jgi:hypothetical protein